MIKLETDRPIYVCDIHIDISGQITINPRSLTASLPSKMVVGRLLSYWVSVTFQGRAVKLREGNS